MTHRTSVSEWLEGFAARVRDRDLEGGKAMFAVDCVAFGTVAGQVNSRQELIEQQWTPIWTSTQGFVFDLDGLVIESSNDGLINVAIVRWRSIGLGPDGTTFKRSGRATIVLRADDSAGSNLIATHSHFSETPAAKSGSAQA